MELLDAFFRTAEKRFQIHIKKTLGDPKPWTDDPIFKRWRFCNVHREDDKTTVWFREHIRKHLSGMDVVRATIAFRWFNRIETGEIIKDLLLNGWDTNAARERLTGVRPVCNGAYIISSPAGYSKLEGILLCIEDAFEMLGQMEGNWETLQQAWQELRQIPYFGRFIAYEVVTDLRWTDVLCNAPDINTWANAGPGCARGLGWVLRRNEHVFNCGSNSDQAQMLTMMQHILEESKKRWPEGWRPWEMREVEHWLCEFDKYMRASSGYPLKRRYDG